VSAPAVYAAISAVQAELAKEGIAKGRRNQQQGFAFRGIDDVYSAIAALLPAHGLCIIPRIVSRETVERATRSGGAMFYVTVHAEFDFVSNKDGSKHTASTYGEASDSGDKATNKAMSAALKYAVLMTFTVPTEGDNDADAHTPPETVPTPELPQVDPADFLLRWQRMLEQAETLAALEKLRKDTTAEREAVYNLDAGAHARVQDEYKKRRAAVIAATAPQAG
jgi:hypothetical protein